MAENQQFDFERSQQLRSKITAEIASLDEALNKVQTKVESVREWWRGGSEEGFIRNFLSTRRDVRRGLDRWLKDYDRLVRDVERAKQEQERALEQALRV